MSKQRLPITLLSALHVIDTISTYEIGTKQARILLVMYLTGCNTSSSIHLKTNIDLVSVRGCVCNLKDKKFIEKVGETETRKPVYSITEKGLKFISIITS